MTKIITYDKEAREKLVKGVDAVANAVKVTLGPKGRNVVLGKPFGTPQIVNDGVTIAKEIELKDPLENAGAQLLKEVSSKTNDVAGDGTTTASILAQSIIHEGLKKLEQNCNPIQMKDGIYKATQDVISFVKSRSVEVDDTTLAQVASISAGNNNEIGTLIAEAIKKAGEDGVVTVEESRSFGTNLKSAEGMQFDKGYISPYFVTDAERMECVLENPIILIVNRKINLIQDLVPTLELCVREQAPLLIVAEDVEGEALSSLVVNNMRKVIRAAAVKAPGFGDSRKAYLEDLAVLTNGTLWTEELGIPLESVATNKSFYGKAARVKITRDDTTIVVTDKSPELDSHISSLRTRLSSETDDYQKEKLQERIAKLTGGVVVIEVGAATETELKERKLRIEDALNATRAAQEEGIVAGGGYTLLEAYSTIGRLTDTTTKSTDDYAQGYNLLIDALTLPVKLIAENSGVDADTVLKTCLDKKLGYNALTGEFEDLLKTGVIDPAKVTRSALENAASIASMLLTTQAAIVDEPAKDGDVNAFQPAGQPMMV